MPEFETHKTTNDIDDLTIGPDIEVIADPTEPSTVVLEADLSLHIAPIAPSDSTIPQIEPLEFQAEPATPSPGRKLIDQFGPEVTAGAVIAVMFAIFATLMILGVSDQSSEEPVVESEVSTPAPVAPIADVPVEIGEGITLERE